MCGMSLSEAHTSMHISLFPLLPFVGELHAPGPRVKMKAFWGCFFTHSRRFFKPLTRLEGNYERILKLWSRDRDEGAKLPIWAVVSSDCTPMGEKYVTSEFADVAQPPCGKPLRGHA